jgi:basic membrane protein A and related proteins
VIARRFLSMALSAGLLACAASAAGDEARPAPRPAKPPLKVALIMGGRANEPGYFNAGFQALLAARSRFGAEISCQESLKPADAEQVLQSLGEDGFHYVIVMGGGNYDDQIREVAADYPAMRFIIVSGSFTQVPNIAGVRTGNPGVAYLAGVLMASMTRTGRIGLIGGRASAPAMADHVAVIAGARSVRGGIAVEDVYTEAYDDPALGKEAALAQIDDGVDIIFTNANSTSLGVFQAAHERRVLAIGSATDQNPVSPDTVLSSAVYGTDVAVTHMIDMDLNGPGWENRIYTVGLEAVGLAPFHSLDPRVPPSVRARLDATRSQLIQGKISIPANYAQLGAAAGPMP